MGVRIAIIHSTEDMDSLWVRMSDESYHIHDEGRLKCYMNIPKIIEIVKLAKVDAVFTGYGFLSESYLFAKTCEQKKIINIGPSSLSIATMGDKIEAKKLMSQNNISVIPGRFESVTSRNQAKEIANELGYPVIFKTRNGGGGKGIKIAKNPKELTVIFDDLYTTSKLISDTEEIYIEKVITNAKHIEVQIIGDKHGNIVSLGERECSIQRNHQKIVEESPSVVIDDSLRKKICKTAVKVARIANYHNAGTVEFLLNENNHYFFMEMNTRIQVEHPVTEMVTGIDIVKEMLNVANNNKLNYNQRDIKTKGHAIEFRICAEDPENNFTSDYGAVTTYRIPEGPGVRIDSGIEKGSVVSLSYDNLCTKVIVWGENRKMAIVRAKNALNELCIVGFNTNIAFHIWLLNNKNFIYGDYNIGFVKEEYNPKLFHNGELLSIMLLATTIKNENSNQTLKTSTKSNKLSNWTLINNWQRSYRK